jgi:hypothetical protein
MDVMIKIFNQGNPVEELGELKEKCIDFDENN